MVFVDYESSHIELLKKANSLPLYISGMKTTGFVMYKCCRQFNLTSASNMFMHLNGCTTKANVIIRFTHPKAISMTFKLHILCNIGGRIWKWFQNVSRFQMTYHFRRMVVNLVSVMNIFITHFTTECEPVGCISLTNYTSDCLYVQCTDIYIYSISKNINGIVNYSGQNYLKYIAYLPFVCLHPFEIHSIT